jgi:hypothetical protein
VEFNANLQTQSVLLQERSPWYQWLRKLLEPTANLDEVINTEIPVSVRRLTPHLFSLQVVTALTEMQI